MNLLNKLERKFGKYSIKNLMFYIVLLNGGLYILTLFDTSGTITSMLTLDKASILHGQLWRLITFIFLPPESSILFIFFVLYFYYIVGTALESEWGSFKFNIYYLVGMLATILAAFIVGDGNALYLNLSLFLAFATIFPDYQILLFFILPVKVKYLAYLQWFFLAYTIIMSPLPEKVAAIVSILNFLLFFGPSIFKNTSRKKNVLDNRKRYVQGYGHSDSKVIPFHKCTVCGMTDSDDPLMEFRFCSKCKGRHEYCSKHLSNHQHLSD